MGHTLARQKMLDRQGVCRLLIKRGVWICLAIALMAALLWPGLANAHNVSKRDASFVQSNQGRRSARLCIWARSIW